MRALASVRRPALAALLAVSAAALVPGCRDRGGADAAAVRVYTIRAEVVGVPPPDAGPRRLVVRHEAVDDFVDASGATVGMGSMVMPLDVAPSVALDGVRAGDVVELRLAAGWSPPLLRIDAIRKLPAGTALEFRRARPPAAHGGDRMR